MRYVVFDVETPNHLNNRISAIGISVVEDGYIVDEQYYLVNPDTEFDRFNIQLTGITPEMVENEPNFKELWEKIVPVMQSGVLVAHNASFDMGVLEKCLRYYEVEHCGSFQYACTCQMSRKFFPELKSHRLNVLCDYLNIPLNHHNAMSDTHGAAEIFIYMTDHGLDPKVFVKRAIIS